MKISEFCIIFLLFFYGIDCTVKVCSTWGDYWNFSKDAKCMTNLDIDADFKDIVARWGKQTESHVVTTKDGYNLTLFRILSAKEDPNPVLLLPASLMNPLAFVNRGDKSLAYQFVEKGYDIWLINWRGTKYSRGHTTLSDRDLKYWDFSFNEWGCYDLPATLAHIKTLNPKKVLLVGFQFGATSALVYASDHADEAAQTITGIVSLSPITVPNNTGLLIKHKYFHVSYVMKHYIKIFHHGEVEDMLQTVRSKFWCRNSGVWIARFCDAIFQFPLGLDWDQQDPETIRIIVAQNRDSESLMNFQHVFHLIRTKKFVKFDHGEKKNMALYGQSTSPEYNLSKIKVPQLFFLGKNDKFGTVADAKMTYQQIDPKYQREFHVIPHEKFGQVDFVQAKDINSLLHKHMMECITKLHPPTT